MALHLRSPPSLQLNKGRNRYLVSAPKCGTNGVAPICPLLTISDLLRGMQADASFACDPFAGCDQGEEGPGAVPALATQHWSGGSKTARN